jgi:hypothetical protein
MKTAIFTLELITPCFCAGADQARAEIRAPAIRGQLRWWFRTLGGSAADERAVFGSVSGTTSASSILIRILSVDPKPWSPPSFTPNDPESYVWYYASASGTTIKGAKGPRWNAHGALGIGTIFKFQILQLRPLTPPLQAHLDLALKYFLQLGAIGLRATRGLGVFNCAEIPFDPAVLVEIRNRGFACEHRTTPLSSIEPIAREIGGLLKGTRKAENMKAERPSPFGSSSPRQTSAIYFRPVRTISSGKDCQLVIFEAPHARVLDPKISGMPPVISHTSSKLTKPAATARRW